MRVARGNIFLAEQHVKRCDKCDYCSPVEELRRKTFRRKLHHQPSGRKGRDVVEAQMRCTREREGRRREVGGVKEVRGERAIEG